MAQHSFLPVRAVLALVPLARGIGKRRTPFVAAYAMAGGEERLDERWKTMRSRALDRILPVGQLWQGGVPTRAHLDLIMWAYSPTPERLDDFIRATSRIPDQGMVG